MQRLLVYLAFASAAFTFSGVAGRSYTLAPQAFLIALVTAGAVDTIVISPIPVAPSGPPTRGVSRAWISTSKALLIVGNLNVTQSRLLPATYSSLSAHPTP